MFKNNLKNIESKLFPLLLALWKMKNLGRLISKARAYTRCVCMGWNSEAFRTKQNLPDCCCFPFKEVTFRHDEDGEERFIWKWFAPFHHPSSAHNWLIVCIFCSIDHGGPGWCKVQRAGAAALISSPHGACYFAQWKNATHLWVAHGGNAHICLLTHGR